VSENEALRQKFEEDFDCEMVTAERRLGLRFDTTFEVEEMQRSGVRLLLHADIAGGLHGPARAIGACAGFRAMGAVFRHDGETVRSVVP
jgi:hypothetical protein